MLRTLQELGKQLLLIYKKSMETVELSPYHEEIKQNISKFNIKHSDELKSESGSDQDEETNELLN